MNSRAWQYCSPATGTPQQSSNTSITANMSAAAPQDVPLLPDYFPGVTKSCAQVGEAFFECFTTHAVKKDATDTTAGVVGVQACQAQLKAYKNCMDKLVGKLETKKFRVRTSSIFISIWRNMLMVYAV